MLFEKISAYIILYHDLQFLEDIILGIYDFLDEIIIIDGPYSYNIEIFKKLNLYYDCGSKSEELKRIINKYPKIKYDFKIFDNEEQKRMYGYDKCSNNIVLLVDTDEFFNININNLNEFIKNETKFVGGFDIFNMNRINVNFNNKVQKYILFKKNIISSKEHLDYTWLINCLTNKPNQDYMELNNSLGTIYHQTLNRNKFNNVIKFIFYLCLHFKTNNLDIQIFNNYNIDELIKIIAIDDLINIFYHSMLVSIGIPDNNNNNICMIKNDVSVNLEKYQYNHCDSYFSKETLCLKKIDAFFLLQKKNLFANELNIELENVRNIIIFLY